MKYEERCGKIRYHDRVAAMLALAKAQRSPSRRRHESRAYHCPKCDGWHLTSKRRGTS